LPFRHDEVESQAVGERAQASPHHCDWSGEAVTAWPRALAGPVMNMARPARPHSEAQLVREAAAIVARETGLTATQPIARIIARRVVDEFMTDLSRGDDPLLVALAALEQRCDPSPFIALATSCDTDLAGEFVEKRVVRLRARIGRALTVTEERGEIDEIASALRAKLEGRYARHIRASIA
jgi:hypothetical protein